MVEVSTGLALGGASKAFQAADQRSVQREAITSRERTATAGQRSQERIATARLTADQEKLVIDRSTGALTSIIGEIKATKSLLTSATSDRDRFKINKRIDSLQRAGDQILGTFNPQRLNKPVLFANGREQLRLALEDFESAELAATAAGRAESLKSEAAAPGAAVKAATVKKAELGVRIEALKEMFSGAGLSPENTDALAEDVENGEAVTAPFDGDIEASDDARTVAQLVTASRRLLIIGDSSTANALLGQARFLAENSPEIQRRNELDQPISESLAREFGLPVGTPLRAALGRIPRSPEDLAQSKATAGARGRGQVEAEEQIGFIGEARGIIGDLLGKVKVDPGLVGIRGSFRSTGKTALNVVGELGLSALLESASDLAFSNTDLSLDQISELTSSSTLSVLSLIENSVGLILARLRTPQGRVPVDVIKRSIKDVKLTGLTGSQQVIDRLEFINNMLGGREQGLQKRFGLGGGKSGSPRFRVEGGKLVPVQ